MVSFSFNATAPSIFTGEYYAIWAVKMKAYLRAFDLLEIVEVGGDPLVMRHADPTIAQLKQHSEEAFNLHREFKIFRLKVKEDETIKEYYDKIMKLFNQLRLLGEDLSERKIVNKVLVSLPEKFEAKISSLEDSKDLSQLMVTELVNTLQAQEQRCFIQNDGQVEGALMVKSRGKVVSNSQRRYGHDNKEKDKRNNDEKQGQGKANVQPCSYCKKRSHLEKFCWYCLNVKCSYCNQMGHVAKVCKAKANNNEEKVTVVEEKKDCDEALFMIKITEKHTMNDVWLIDNGYSNHITSHMEICPEVRSSENAFPLK
ncbi:Uncharacterized protein TCM_033746 [Theobroma cacao]|uniref:CCHC-type domain-containing protein n=1 Tax=Theobroma cacao TaxID=3641 RepID=A0A061FIN2_THECC|nr:Uncharacterized protein TCM_033746 [Theobroma cacao]